MAFNVQCTIFPSGFETRDGPWLFSRPDASIIFPQAFRALKGHRSSSLQHTHTHTPSRLHCCRLLSGLMALVFWFDFATRVCFNVIIVHFVFTILKQVGKAQAVTEEWMMWILLLPVEGSCVSFIYIWLIWTSPVKLSLLLTCWNAFPEHTSEPCPLLLHFIRYLFPTPRSMTSSQTGEGLTG